MAEQKTPEKAAPSLASLATQGKQGFLGELLGMLWSHKKWWLTPIVLVLLALAVLIVLGGTGAAPFIYTIF